MASFSFCPGYSLAENVAPADLIRESDEDEVDAFLIKKEVSHYGLTRTKHIRDYFYATHLGVGQPSRFRLALLKKLPMPCWRIEN